MVADRDEMLEKAARRADWQQVVLNGGPPCFYLESDGRFCLRAERWAGHTQKEEWPEHRYVSLAALLHEVRREALASVRKLYISGDEYSFDGVYVEWRGKRYGKGPVLWAVTNRSACLNRSGEWEVEVQPSSRDDAFIARCRWESMDEALAAAIHALAQAEEPGE